MRRDLQFLGEVTDDGVIAYDRDEVRQALLDLEGAVHQLGGRITMAAVRQRISGSFVTVGMLVTYSSHDITPPEVRDGEAWKPPEVEDEVEEVTDGAVPTG